MAPNAFWKLPRCGRELSGTEGDIDPAVDTRIIRMAIYPGSGCIRGLVVVYPRNNGKEMAYTWGTTDTTPTEIILDPKEYIIAVSGNCDDWVRLLKVETNFRTVTAAGNLTYGAPFQLPAFGGQIFGFHVRQDTFLRAIGTYVKEIDVDAIGGGAINKNVITAPIAFWKLQRCGGEYGSEGDIDPAVDTRIIRMSIYPTNYDVIGGLVVVYPRNNGKEMTYTWGSTDSKPTEIILDPREYITVVSGNCDDWVRLLKVETNFRTFTTVGHATKGAPFQLPALGGQIFGFHVRHDIGTYGYLRAIGTYVKEIDVDAIGGGAIYKNVINPPSAIQKLIRYGKEEGRVGDINPTSVIRIMKVGIQSSESGIEALTVHYERTAGEESINRWGAKRNMPKEIILQANEYLTAVRGHYSDIVKELILETNVRTYGPFGMKEGTPFNFSALGGQIIGFHARYTTTNLRAVGVYIKKTDGNSSAGGATDEDETTELVAQKLGPSGGDGGTVRDMPDVSCISTVQIRHGNSIDALIVTHENFEGDEITSRWGGRGGQPTTPITLADNEYITTVSGTYDKVVRSIQIDTNLNSYGSFGVKDGIPFKYSSLGGQITGFHGRSSRDLLTAIGVYVKITEARTDGAFEKLGPSGGDEGREGHIDPSDVTRITAIHVRHGTSIDALTVHYRSPDEHKTTARWGGHGGQLTEITLQPTEYITAVSGHYYDSSVFSLKFTTNFCTYGPFGTERGTPFEFPYLSGPIIAFHARYGARSLHAIGVYVKVTGGREIGN